MKKGTLKTALFVISLFISANAFAQLGNILDGNWKIDGNKAENGDFLGTKNNKALVLKSNSIEGLRIAINGNVGIGGITPMERFHVLGNSMLEGNLSLLGTATIQDVLTAKGFVAGINHYKFSDGTVQTTAVSLTNGSNAIFGILKANTFSLVNNASIGGALTITGSTTGNNAMFSNLQITTVSSSGNAAIGGNVSVTGTATIQDQLTAKGFTAGSNNYKFSDATIQTTAVSLTNGSNATLGNVQTSSLNANGLISTNTGYKFSDGTQQTTAANLTNGSNANFGTIQASSLSLTNNANIAGNLSLAGNGDVAQNLTVNGTLDAKNGLRFADGTTQNTAVVFNAGVATFNAANVIGQLKVGTHSLILDQLTMTTGTLENHIYSTPNSGSLFLQSQNGAGYDQHTILNYNNNGKVGIGTNAPETKLVVRSDNSNPYPAGDRANQFMIQGQSNPALKFNFGIATQASVPYAEIGFVEEAISWRNIAIAKQNGSNVGIGMTDPQAKLHVNGSVSINNVDGNTSLFFGQESVAPGILGQWGIQYNSGGLNFWKPYGSTGSFGNNYLFLKDANGYVGIGTGDPQAQLHVNGSISISNVDGNTSLFFGQESVAPSTLGQWGIQYNSGGLNFWKPYGSSGPFGNAYLFLKDANGFVGIGTDNPRYRLDVAGPVNTSGLYINGVLVAGGNIAAAGSWAANGSTLFYNGGNVGIGTNNTGSFKLAVEGKIGAREMKITQAAWADYVFEKEHKLSSLAEIDSYITENKHLPNFPSACEVEEQQGFDVGQMQVKTLATIEELYLHVIEQDKTIKALQQKLSAIEQNQLKK